MRLELEVSTAWGGFLPLLLVIPSEGAVSSLSLRFQTFKCQTLALRTKRECAQDAYPSDLQEELKKPELMHIHTVEFHIDIY